MKIAVNHIPLTTPLGRRQGVVIAPTTITIHNTGNASSTAKNEREWLTNPGNSRQASFHIGVDDNQAIECIPLNEKALHSGTREGNYTSISVEICESGNYEKALDNAAVVVAGLLKERGWGIDRLRRHYDWSGKICPRLMYDGGSWKGWEVFKELVRTKLGGEEIEYMLKKEDAEKIIKNFLQPEFADAKRKGDERGAAEAHRLANELRKAAGQKLI
ncbi:peptidoglycan recognition protein family protein [Paenibacillus gansuensis]|uniref:N-acetylmuramoyl-L-alanine amidase n=1 Tax=Paenibacillus gansuensis TaxID=306542 RepID=A0ABW5PJ15_9BACL